MLCHRNINHLRKSLCLSSVYGNQHYFCSVSKLSPSAATTDLLSNTSLLESIRHNYKSDQLTLYLSNLNLSKNGNKGIKITRLLEHFQSNLTTLDTMDESSLLIYHQLFFNAPTPSQLSKPDLVSTLSLFAAGEPIAAEQAKESPENTEPEKQQQQQQPRASETFSSPVHAERQSQSQMLDLPAIEIDEKNSFVHRFPIDTCSKVSYGNGSEITFETSRIGHLTEAAVVVSCKGTMVFSTACSKLQPDLKFGDNLDLKVDAHERSWPRGYIPSGIQRSDGGITDYEILLCRMIDRSIRPLFVVDDAQLATRIQPAYEVQILSNLLSCDDVYDSQVLAINGASTAVYLSPNIDIGGNGPIAAVRVIVDERGEFIANPTKTQMEDGATKCNLLYVGTGDNCVMIETDATMIDDARYGELLQFAQSEVVPVIDSIKQLKLRHQQQNTNTNTSQTTHEVMHKYRKLSALKPALLDEAIVKKYEQQLFSLYASGDVDKNERNAQRDALQKQMVSALLTQFAHGYDVHVHEQQTSSVLSMLSLSEWTDFYGALFYELDRAQFRASYLHTQRRCDGRQFDELRSLQHMVDILPSCHGSSLFQRGNTQTLCSATVGPPRLSRMRDLHRSGHPLLLQRLYFQYEMPPSATNEIKGIQSKNRRAVGHANIALNALKPLLPSFEAFPYSVRVFSNITASDGSSSMASVCGGSLCLMDAGVPMTEAAAGISIGLVGDHLLTDIAGIEDHFGDMDFKVAGTLRGINSVQLDIKRGGGVPVPLILSAITQAKATRVQILASMNATIAQSKESLKAHAPRVEVMSVPFRDIPRVIGSGGAVKKQLEIENHCDIEIFWEQEQIEITADNLLYLHKAKQAVMDAIGSQCRVGDIVTAKIVNIQSYGVMIAADDGSEHLVHISQWVDTGNMEEVNQYEVGSHVELMCIGFLGENRPNFSRKAAVWQLSTDPEDRARLRLMLDSLRPPARSRSSGVAGLTTTPSAPSTSATASDAHLGTMIRHREPLSIFSDGMAVGDDEDEDDGAQQKEIETAADADPNAEEREAATSEDDDDDEDSTFPDILPPKQSFSFSPKQSKSQQQQAAKKQREPQVQIDNDAIKNLIDSLDDDGSGQDAKLSLSRNKSRFATLYQGIQAAKTDSVPAAAEADGGSRNVAQVSKTETKTDSNSFSKLLDSIDTSGNTSRNGRTSNGVEDDNFSFLSIFGDDDDNKTKRGKPRNGHKHSNKTQVQKKETETPKDSLDEWKNLSKTLISKDRTKIERDDVGDDLLKDLFGDEHSADAPEAIAATKETGTETHTTTTTHEERKQEHSTARAAQLMASIPELMEELNCSGIDTQANGDDGDDEEEQWPWQQQQKHA